MKTNKNLFRTALLAALSLALLPGIAAAQEMKTLHGHVPAAISRGHLKSIGQLPEDTTVSLAIGLPLRNTGALSNLLEQVYDPASPNYHHYLTPEQFTEQFGPTQQAYQQVKEFARAHGLVVIGEHPNRMILDVRGKASDIQKAFQVTLRNYHSAAENRDFYAPDSEPSVPAALSVEDIMG